MAGRCCTARGSRRTGVDEVYREYVGKIVNELGKRYGNDPRVWGWQLDNELSHYGKEPSYATPARRNSAPG